MAKVTLVFVGVAMSYLKDEKWKVIFPFDDCHKVQFEHKGEEIPLNQPNTEIIVDVASGKAPAAKGKDFNKIFDITSADVHSAGVKLRPNWREKGVLLEVPNATMSMGSATRSRFQLKKGNKTKNLNKIAFSAKAEINLKKGGSVTINVKGVPGFPKTFKDSDGDQIIRFNNNCDGNPASEKGDLQMLYENIIDVPAKEQVTVDRRPEDQPTAAALAAALAGGDLAFSHPNNLFPGEEGLPCYVVAVSKTDNLI